MDTRQQIIKATTQMFQTRGLAKTTTKDIARAAGCAEGTLYNYFEHKEDLFMAVLEENLAGVAGLIDLEKIGEQQIEVNLEQLALAAINFLDQILPMSAALFADPALLANYRQLLKAQQRGPQYSYKFFEPYLRAEQQLGRIAADKNLLAVGALLYGGCLQYVFSRHFLGDEPFSIPIQQFIKDLVNTLMIGLEAKNNDENKAKFS